MKKQISGEDAEADLLAKSKNFRIVGNVTRQPESPSAIASTMMKESPSTDQEWKRLTADLALCLADLSEDEFLVLTSKRLGCYVQFADQGHFGLRAEAATCIWPGGAKAAIPVEAFEILGQLGWRFHNELPDSLPDPDGSQNAFADLSRPINFAALAELAVQTFRRVYRIQHPGLLQYKSFNSDRASIRFPTLRLKREG